MRICLVSQEYPPETAHGGIGAQTHCKAHGLAARGHAVLVISHAVGTDRVETRDGEVAVVRIPSADTTLPIASDAVRWLSYSLAVAAEIERQAARLDLVDFPDWGSEGFVYLLNRAPGKSVPAIIHLHGPIAMFGRALGWPDPASAFFATASHMEATCLRLADAIFSSSRCSAEWVAREYGVDADAVSIVHSGIDLDLFRPRQVATDGLPRIVFVGKIARNKGLELLCRAALVIAPEIPNLRLRIIGRGDGVLLQSLIDKAAVQGFPDLIEAIGFAAADSLPDYLASGQIFAAPSFYEGGPGFVYLEAMACGLPVVGCAGSGASEAIRDGENGLLVPPGDVDALAGALRRLLGDAALRARLAAGALAFVRREADSRLCLARLERLYRGIVERHGRG